MAETDLLSSWPDAAQRERALTSLMADGLVVRTSDRLTLP
jgi:A/G-specific adenine glycosylase